VRASLLQGAPELNHALGISTVEQLDALRTFYGGGHHAVSPAPGVDLDGILRERDYEPGYAWMKFSRGVGEFPVAETDLEVGEIVDDRPSNSYRNILRAGFEPQYLRANYVPKIAEPGAASQVNATGSSRPA